MPTYPTIKTTDVAAISDAVQRLAAALPAELSFNCAELTVVYNGQPFTIMATADRSAGLSVYPA